MVAKLIALYKQPAEPQAFDKTYFEQHIPLVKQIPGLQLVEVSKITGAPDAPPQFYLMAELYFDNMDAVKAGLESPEGKAAHEHAISFAGDLVTLLFAEVPENS